jgi:beta-phosphoglucomutase-like phosphatase (HAD superfamily)
MNLKYKCLLLDHDDTAVESTSTIHYPAHLNAMEKIRPSMKPISLEEWYQKNFHPGIMTYLRDELKMNEEEMKEEYKIWRKFTTSTTPSFYDGFIDTLKEFKKRGGYIAIASHSERDIIERDYKKESTHGNGISPDLIFGWNNDKSKRKPNPFPVLETLKRLQLKREDILLLDDLKPGVLMAKEAGIKVAAAGWSHQIPEIVSYMKEQCDMYFQNIDQFANHILL